MSTDLTKRLLCHVACACLHRWSKPIYRQIAETSLDEVIALISCLMLLQSLSLPLMSRTYIDQFTSANIISGLARTNLSHLTYCIVSVIGLVRGIGLL